MLQGKVDELQPVVTALVAGSTAQQEEPFQQLDDLLR